MDLGSSNSFQATALDLDRRSHDPASAVQTRKPRQPEAPSGLFCTIPFTRVIQQRQQQPASYPR